LSVYIIITNWLGWLPPAYSAQKSDHTHDSPTVKRNSCACFYGRPRPRCCSYWVIESSYKTRVSGSLIREDKSDFVLSADLGYMVNLGARASLGGTVYLSGDDDGARLALRPRYRRWLDPEFVLDISPGIIVAGSDNKLDLSMPGFIGTVSIGLANWIALSLQYEAIRVRGSYLTGPWGNPELKSVDGTQSALSFGVTLSHWPAIVSPIVLVVLIGATWD